tara:strand:+ start:3702 stop:4577 length:876 start_codon:yes stop_codon:yes gene_type:complete
MKPKICVVGSANIDQISYVQRIPIDGETIFGDSYQMGFGGKGANQAVMAGLLGADTFMIACLGTDVYKDMTINNFKDKNVKTDFIQIVDGSSGVAPIWVDSNGQNRIIVIAGANEQIDSNKVIKSLEEIGNVSLIVGQAEIPMKVNYEVFKFAKENNITTIFNPAPGRLLDKQFLTNVDWLIPNETEFEIISNTNLTRENILKFSNKINSKLIVTLGEEGAIFVNDDKVEEFKAPSVDVVDTTGAGDAFVGAFSYAISENYLVSEAINFAINKASLSVTKRGTQSSYSSSE